MKSPLVLASATALLALEGQVCAQTPAPATPSAASPKPPASSGLLNDWLRKESSGFEAWDIGGQVRIRYEVFNNASPAYPNRDFQARGVDNDNSYVWTRERLHIGYKAPWVRAYVEGQNCDASDDKDPRNLGQASFDLHQAYITVGNLKQFPLTATVGRQELLYGDERLIGPSDWSNPGRAFDAAKLHFEHEKFWVDAFTAHIVISDDQRFDESDHHDWFSGLYASSSKLIPIQETQLYFLSRNAGTGAAVSQRDIYTIGARVKSLPGKLDGWDYTAEFIGQLGSVNQSKKRRDQEAFAYIAAGGYTWQKAFASPRAGLEYCYSTGDSDPNDGKSQTLDTLFGTNHKFYGTMDYVGLRNLHDLRFTVSGKPFKNFTASVDYHLFWLADTHDSFYPQGGSGRSSTNGYGRNPGYDSFIGSELDVELAYKVASWGALRGGYGHFFPGSYIESSLQKLGGAKDADWVYIQATFSF